MLIKANLTKNFGLNTKNQFFKTIDFTVSTASTDVTGSIDTIGFMGLLKILMPLDL
jgi:hypothetical protein